MDNQTSGYSSVSADADTARAFGFPAPEGETAATTAKQDEPQKEAPKEEDHAQEPGIDETRELKKKATDSHRQVIDLISEKFESLKNRKMEDQELRDWFLEHPEFSDIANRSKRVKDDFRSLMERSPEVRRGEKEVKTVSDKEVTDDTEKKPNLTLPEEKPLTAADLKKMLDDRDERLIEKTLQQERRQKSEEFAVKHNIVDDEYDYLDKTANALFEINHEWDFSRALEAALLVLRGSKPSPVNVNTSNRVPPSENQPKVDLTQTTELINWKEFSGNR